MFISPWFPSCCLAISKPFVLLDHYTLSLKYWKLNGNKLLKDQRQLSWQAEQCLRTGSNLRGARELPDISLVALPDGPCFVCPLLQKALGNHLFVLFERCKSLVPISMPAWTGSKLAHCHNRRKGMLRFQKRVEKTFGVCGAAWQGQEGTKWWCQEERDSSRRTLFCFLALWWEKSLEIDNLCPFSLISCHENFLTQCV